MNKLKTWSLKSLLFAEITFAIRNKIFCENPPELNFLFYSFALSGEQGVLTLRRKRYCCKLLTNLAISGNGKSLRKVLSGLLLNYPCQRSFSWVLREEKERFQGLIFLKAYNFIQKIRFLVISPALLVDLSDCSQYM